ncbi:MAG: polyprenyl synthetase family protein [Thermoplasmatota archaeon]
MDAGSMMASEREKIEAELVSFFKKERKGIVRDDLALRVLDELRDFTLRDAKRVRSVLTVMGYRAVGGRDLRKARKAAVSLELIQTMLLIHDDIMDRSERRRGEPSFHRIFGSMHERSKFPGDPERFGINMALIAGDLAESLGEKALLTSGFPAERIHDALVCQADMIRDTGIGQVFDIYSEALPTWSEEMVIKVHTYKTARYTLDSPLRIGAHLHGASEEQLASLSSYAIPVGIAFQLIDDILGFYGDPKKGGRADLSDIKEGKRTLLIVKALELTDAAGKRKIMNGLGNPGLAVKEAENIRAMIREGGSEGYSRMKAREYTEIGKSALKGTDLDPEIVTFLEELAELLVGRA